ncbi:unnamed protein product [Caenorhabditis angaria]|uniref:Uncharacterized protein n=1 Tax=Caenorhabditis angaria TaxID=860376 RepID=A0A9P1I4X2_9PELO|nr:unnamed protein product [Caenorhabditis angaria]
MSSRKPLIRSSSHSDRPTKMRNWPLFVFLIGLVLFFYIFYIYQAQSTTLSMANDEIRMLNIQLSNTKTKLVDTLASLESVNAVQRTSEAELDELRKKSEECFGNLRNSKLRLDGLEKDNKENTENNNELQSKLKTAELQITDFERNNTALINMVKAQEELIQQLNQTVAFMKNEKQTQIVAEVQLTSTSTPSALEGQQNQQIAEHENAQNEKLAESTTQKQEQVPEEQEQAQQQQPEVRE